MSEFYKICKSCGEAYKPSNLKQYDKFCYRCKLDKGLIKKSGGGSPWKRK